MSAMPANPPFHSQLAARPNNRRHHQPTATHPQTTSTPNLSQTLMISRQTLDGDLSYSAHTGSGRTCPLRMLRRISQAAFHQQLFLGGDPLFRQFAPPLPSRKSPQIPKITVQTTVKRSPGHLARRLNRARAAPPIPKIPPNPKNHSSDNPPNCKSQPIPNIP